MSSAVLRIRIRMEENPLQVKATGSQAAWFL